jgi:hypothetical protein
MLCSDTAVGRSPPLGTYLDFLRVLARVLPRVCLVFEKNVLFSFLEYKVLYIY